MAQIWLWSGSLLAPGPGSSEEAGINGGGVP